MCLRPPEQPGYLGISSIGRPVPQRDQAGLNHVRPVQDTVPEHARPEPEVDELPRGSRVSPGKSASAATLARTNVKGWRTTHAGYGS